jgi:uncharacterized protein
VKANLHSLEYAAKEWPETLDMDTLLSTGWMPRPFRQVLLKLHSRCNLSCDYCYMYTMADQGWRNKPHVMSPAIVAVVARRIAEHARAHSLDTVRVIFHGGEPLLSGAGPLVDGMRVIRNAVDARVRVEGLVQTNGTLLSDAVLDALEELEIRVGISLDGDVANHDRNRHYRNGRGSHAGVAGALRRLRSHPGIYGGILSVVNVEADPVRSYEALLEFSPPMIDFLLPHRNWSVPPDRPDPAMTPYAQWLIAVFERWYGAASRETRIRLFEELIHLLLGGMSESEAVGLTRTSLIVIETDGSIEQTDALKSTYADAARTGLHVARDSFDAALRLPQFAARQLGLDALAEECQACQVGAICGAGLYPHRYRAGHGFRNPSVYCQDLYTLILHIRDRLASDLRTARAVGGARETA